MKTGRVMGWRALIGLLAASAGGPAMAQVVILTDPAQFVGATTIVNFDTYPDLSVVPYSSSDLDTDWLAMGILISDDTTGNGASAYSGTFSVSPHSGTRAVADSTNSPGGFINFGFVLPNTLTPTTVLEAGIWVLNGDAGSTVSFFDSSGALIQSLTPAVGSTFAGLRASQGIASIRITDADYYLVDDLQFTTLAAVPEPSVWVLLTGGLALGWLVRRRRMA